MNKNVYVFLLATLVLLSCQPKLNFPIDGDNNKNLNSLTTLNIGENTIFLQDFISDPTEIDSITSSSSKLKCTIDSSKTTATFMVPADMEPFVDVKLWSKAVPYSLPCRKTDKVEYDFTFDPQGKNYSKVQIAGQMNDWTASRTPDLQLNSKGFYSTKLLLSPGTYLYQLVLDGEQNYDPSNPDKVDNGYGKFNSLLQIKGQGDKYPFIYTHKFGLTSIMLHTKNDVNNIFVYWQNYLLPSTFVSFVNGDILISIPADASKLERSYIRVWASNDMGVSNDVLIPLKEGKVLSEAEDITRDDKQAQIMYFALVDRFCDGDSSNNHPLNLPDVNPKVDFWGGDLAGIKKQIDNGYFSYLGVNTLWISPLNQNPLGPYGYYAPMKTKFSGYHGYWPVSSTKVDYRFGTNDEFKNLVADAHEKNMNVLLDYVAHHVHIEHPFYKQHPEWATDLYLPDGTLNTEKWDEYRLTTWFDTFMPTLDLLIKPL